MTQFDRNTGSFQTEIDVARSAIDRAEERHGDAIAVLNQMADDLATLSNNVSRAIAKLKVADAEPPAVPVRLLAEDKRLAPSNAKPAGK